MDKKNLRLLRYKLFGQIVLIVALCFAAGVLLLRILDGPLNDFIANTMHDIWPKLYYFLRSNKGTIIALCFGLVVCCVVYFSVCRVTRYISLIVHSIDTVFRKDASLVNLPRDFAEVENKLNSIKYESLKNEQAAREAEKRKDDLVVYLAHDLKTPLTSVIGYLSLLHDEREITPALREHYVEISLQKAQRLESLINEFFEITRFNLQNIELEETDINLTLLLSQLADEFYPLLSPKNLTCKLHVDDGLTLRGDADKLARVFDNLLRNAINYSAENSGITITAGQRENTAEVFFRNTGSRIPERQLQSIFSKFYRLDSARSSQTGGSGLGLAIAKEIVELHGGRITAASSDEYTEFAIRLPLSKSKPAAPAQETPAGD